MRENKDIEMKPVEEIVDLKQFTEQGQEMIREAYEVIKVMDKGLTKDQMTTLTNFLDMRLFECYAMLREKERVMHGIKL